MKPSGQSHPVGKPWPGPAWEPRWCRLLPTAWLSGFPSGLTSCPPHPPPDSPTTVPRELGRPLAELALSPAGLPKPVLPTPWSQISPQGSRRGDPPIPLGLFRAGRPHPHSFCYTLRPQLWAAITGLGYGLLFLQLDRGGAAGGRLRGYQTSEKAPSPHSH